MINNQKQDCKHWKYSEAGTFSLETRLDEKYKKEDEEGQVGWGYICKIIFSKQYFAKNEKKDIELFDERKYEGIVDECKRLFGERKGFNGDILKKVLGEKDDKNKSSVDLIIILEHNQTGKEKGLLFIECKHSLFFDNKKHSLPFRKRVEKCGKKYEHSEELLKSKWNELLKEKQDAEYYMCENRILLVIGRNDIENRVKVYEHNLKKEGLIPNIHLYTLDQLHTAYFQQQAPENASAS